MKDLKFKQVAIMLKHVSEISPPPRPAVGWLKVIREALSMTTLQFAKRLGVIQQRVSALEKAEASGSLKLKTLEEAAQAIDCRLVYYLVPNQSIEKLMEEQARKAAKRIIDESSHTMDLESQSITKEEYQRMVELIAHDLKAKNPKKLWDK